MYIRKAKKEEIPYIMEIYARARAFMAANGNPDQWKEGYPSEEKIRQDEALGNLYVCEEEGQIAAVFVFFVGEEPNYQMIQGQWLNDKKPYGTLHRIASAGICRGIASFCLKWCCQQWENMRGDTHEDNIPMQRVFEKNGFQKCGIIYVEDGTPRIAYQRVSPR